MTSSHRASGTDETAPTAPYPKSCGPMGRLGAVTCPHVERDALASTIVRARRRRRPSLRLQKSRRPGEHRDGWVMTETARAEHVRLLPMLLPAIHD